MRAAHVFQEVELVVVVEGCFAPYCGMVFGVWHEVGLVGSMFRSYRDVKIVEVWNRGRSLSPFDGNCEVVRVDIDVLKSLIVCFLHPSLW
jgi:hypothetical protein